MQLPIFAPEVTWRPPSISELPDWNRAKRLGYDLECKDPNLRKKFPGTTQNMGSGAFRKDGFICGFGFTLEGHRSYYLPVRHAGGGNLPLQEVLRYMRDQAANFEGEVVGANLSYDLDWGPTDGVEFKRAKDFLDIQVAQPLINELDQRMDYDAIMERHGLPLKNKAKMLEASRAHGLAGKNDKDVMRRFWELPAAYAGEYGEGDTLGPLLAMREQEKLFGKYDLWNIWKIEKKLTPILAKMKARGIRVNLDKLDRVQAWALKQEQDALALIKHQTGVDVPTGQVFNKDLLVPVFRQLGVRLNPMRMKKSGDMEYQINAAVLASQRHVPALEALEWARSVNLLRTKFAVQTRNCTVNGRLHATIKQIAISEVPGEEKGARYGRMSIVNPPLQQAPSQDVFAPMWRDVYEPEEGAMWASLDYSQQEPRQTTDIAASVMLPGGRRLKGACEAAAAYRNDPTMDNHTYMAKLLALPGDPEKVRKLAKRTFLGLCYNQGGPRLCQQFGLPTAWRVTFSRGLRRTTKVFESYREARQASTDFQGESWYREVAGAEGQSIIDRFNERVPYVKQLAELAQGRAASRGYIRTRCGRVLHFPEKADAQGRGTGEYDWLHKTLNRLIQASGADQIKSAMVQIETEMPSTFMQMQVHDELTGSFGSVAEAKRCAQIMENALGKTNVPYPVDVEGGSSWGDIVDLSA